MTTERQILFSGPMVRAILDGRKSQTRRVVKPQPDGFWDAPNAHAEVGLNAIVRDDKGHARDVWINCPYGKPGDRLWVRETWRTDADYDPYAPRQIDSGASLFMLASEQPYRTNHNPECGLVKWGKTRPGIFMPRWASRINLEVTDVRVERVQELSRADEIAEGVNDGEFYDKLWDSINGRRFPFASNPFVWVVSFTRSGQ